MQPSQFMNIWASLESSTGALCAIWREHLGAQFDIFKAAFLQVQSEPAQSFPCRKCGCAHDVIIHSSNDIVAVCSCEPWNCDEIKLTPAEIQILDLNWSKLGRALCKAFGLDVRAAALRLPNTRQIGCWSADAVPVILTIQRETSAFRAVLAELAARLRQRFIL